MSTCCADTDPTLWFEGEYAAIPERMQDAIRRYVLGHEPVGGFLSAVICNDLRGATGSADSTNLPLLKLYVQWFYNMAPARCYGNPAKMAAWLRSAASKVSDFSEAANVVIAGLNFECTCAVCPEQYSVFNAAGSQVGYLRLRHGKFRVDVPDVFGQTVYESTPRGIGCFEPDEREQELRNAAAAINAFYAQEQRGGECSN